jgi:hypothetical protein
VCAGGPGGSRGACRSHAGPGQPQGRGQQAGRDAGRACERQRQRESPHRRAGEGRPPCLQTGGKAAREGLRPAGQACQGRSGSDGWPGLTKAGAKPAKPAKPAKVKKPKLVRERFTATADDCAAVVRALKQRAGQAGNVPVKKGTACCAPGSAHADRPERHRFKAELGQLPPLKPTAPIK